MNNFHTAKKPTISSSFYDSYTTKPVKWYEIVDAYRQQTETYLPLRLENYPREFWENFRGFFRSNEATEEINDEEAVAEVQQTRPDGNIIKVTEYDLTKDKFNPMISDAVRTTSEKNPRNTSTNPERQSRVESRVRTPPSPVPQRRRRHQHRHTTRVSPTYDDCPECRALGAQGFPTMCQCSECQAARASYPTRVPYCDCVECRNTRRT